MLKNKTNSIILAGLTFIICSILIVNIIFYFLGYPLSSLSGHQIYVFFAILVSAVLASMVYGRGSKERASHVREILMESFKITVEEKIIYQVLRTIEAVPPFVVQKYVSLNINTVEEFDNKIKQYKSELSDEDLSKIRKIVETPAEELQIVLGKIYLKTNMEQFKIISEPEAKPLIELNLQELKKILFD